MRKENEKKRGWTIISFSILFCFSIRVQVHSVSFSAAFFFKILELYLVLDISARAIFFFFFPSLFSSFGVWPADPARYHHHIKLQSSRVDIDIDIDIKLHPSRKCISHYHVFLLLTIYHLVLRGLICGRYIILHHHDDWCQHFIIFCCNWIPPLSVNAHASAMSLFFCIPFEFPAVRKNVIRGWNDHWSLIMHHYIHNQSWSSWR